MERFIHTVYQVQLPSYNFTKNLLVKNEIMSADSTLTFLVSSSFSGACVVSRYTR